MAKLPNANPKILQLSDKEPTLLFALQDLIINQGINWDEWWEDWRKGTFIKSEKKTKTPQPEWKTPQLLDITLPTSEAGCKTYRYWRDKDKPSESIIISGTPPMLVQQIVEYDHAQAKEQPGQSITSDVIRYSGTPEITLFFRSRDTSVPTSARTTGEKSFRLVGYTDNPITAATHQNLELITQADINRIGTKIKSIFRTTPPYVWSKGKKQVTYHDWHRGYNLNVYASSYAEGERLVIAILAIRSIQIDETFLKYKEAKNPAKAYPPAREIQVLGEKYKTTERLPNADVEFLYAQIYLPTIKEAKLIS